MPPKPRTLDAVVRAAEKVLGANDVDHVFVGGVTVLAFGAPRTTSDVDVIAAVTPEKIGAIVASFQRLGFFASAQDLHDALVEGGHCTIQDTRSTYRIDLVPASTDSHRDALRTRRRVRWRGRELPMAAPEHTIVVKLEWGSSQDLEDALAMYLRQKENLDLPMMRAFARRRGISRELSDFEDRAKSLSEP